MRFPAVPFRHVTLRFDRPWVVGVVNVTPDSFSDGGRHETVEGAVLFALQLVTDGADVLDVGGESTRPQGAAQVTAGEEIARVVPVIRALAGRTEVPISVDTTKADVAAAALDAGAELVNDVSGGRFDPRLVEVAAARSAALVLGHLRGHTLAEAHAAPPPSFAEVTEELGRAVLALPRALRLRTIVDPGIGFGKGTRESLELLARAGELGARVARPVMVGPSRKRFLGELAGPPPRPVGERDDLTVGACLAAVAAGADLVRLHAVKRTRDALAAFAAVRGAAAPASGAAPR